MNSKEMKKMRRTVSRNVSGMLDALDAMPLSKRLRFAVRLILGRL